MPDNDKKRAAHLALVERIVNGAGRASGELRATAFAGGGLPPLLDTLLSKVTARPVQVTDADFTGAKSAGFSEDELFELVVCAAVGQSSRMYSAGLAALDEATADGQAG